MGFWQIWNVFLKNLLKVIGNSNHLQKQTHLINSLNNIRTRCFLSNHWPPIENQTLTALQVEIEVQSWWIVLKLGCFRTLMVLLKTTSSTHPSPLTWTVRPPPPPRTVHPRRRPSLVCGWLGPGPREEWQRRAAPGWQGPQSADGEKVVLFFKHTTKTTVEARRARY